MQPIRNFASLIAFAGAALTGLVITGPADAAEKPAFIRGEILRTTYDGIDDDLLTAGLGKTGLGGPTPTLSDPPSASELRRLAIYNNYRALLDMTPGGGYGALYGPNVDLDGNDTLGEGLIAGVETLAFAGDGSGKINVTMMVQVPDHFDPAAPCILAAPSSGSRGVYGAISSTGEWGLKRGCAVAYTDKGTGMGVHDLSADTVNLIDGTRDGAGAAGKDSTFTARVSPVKLAAFNAATPNRFAFKHAHSRRNPEADWGRNVLQSIEFAFHVLNLEYPGTPITPDTTIVVASSVSNGGGSSLRAAEQDKAGLIDAVVVSEPNVNPAPGAGFAIRQGSGDPLTAHGLSLFDYTTLLNLYQGCANLAAANAAAPFNFTPAVLGANRCQSLADKGLLSGITLADQAAEAQAILEQAGINPEQNFTQPSHWWAFVSPAVALTYANAYARARVTDNLCGYSFGATVGNILFPNLGDPAQGLPVPAPAAAVNALFGSANGVPPSGGINLINNVSVGGPREERVSVSASTGRQDQNLDGALCLRGLATGADPVTGAQLKGPAAGIAERIAEGVAAIRASGNLRGKPALIVTGRSDAILPINHASRPYVGLNALVEGGASNLSYIEITNAHHLDAFNAFAGFDAALVPLHHYLVQALGLMFDHLETGAALPPSQVVHTIPRGPGAPPIVEAVNLPPIEAAPAADALITFDGTTLFIPE